MGGYLLCGALLSLAAAGVFAGLSFLSYRQGDDYGSLWELASILLGVVAVVVLVLGAVFTTVNVWTLKSCEHQAERMDLNWDYSVWTPCLVELPDGRWVDVDEIENNHLTGEVTLKDEDR